MRKAVSLLSEVKYIDLEQTFALGTFSCKKGLSPSNHLLAMLVLAFGMSCQKTLVLPS